MPSPNSHHSVVKMKKKKKQEYNCVIKTLICILLFIGAFEKSAQIRLPTWSLDAMEGPTPVSAWIHVATMVTTGVFMIAGWS